MPPTKTRRDRLLMEVVAMNIAFKHLMSEVIGESRAGWYASLGL
jgi:hypothetical protein